MIETQQCYLIQYWGRYTGNWIDQKKWADLQSARDHLNSLMTNNEFNRSLEFRIVIHKRFDEVVE